MPMSRKGIRMQVEVSVVVTIWENIWGTALFVLKGFSFGVC